MELYNKLLCLLFVCHITPYCAWKLASIIRVEWVPITCSKFKNSSSSMPQVMAMEYSTPFSLSTFLLYRAVMSSCMVTLVLGDYYKTDFLNNN